MVSRLIPKFLVSPSTRLYYLRTVIALSAITIWYGAWLCLIAERSATVIIPVVITCVTFVHHLGTAFGPRVFKMPNIVDLILSVLEMACATYLMVMLIYWGNFSTEALEWFPKRAVFGLCVFCGLTLMLAGLLILKFCDLVCSPRGTVFLPVDIRCSRIFPPVSEWKEPSSHLQGWKYAAGALFGRKPWKENIPGESRWVRHFRGLMTVIVILVLSTYGAYKTVLRPIAERGMLPSHDFRVIVLPGNFKASGNIVYNVLVAWDPQLDAPKTLLDAVSVGRIPQGPEGGYPEPCPKSWVDLPKWELPKSYVAVMFNCTPTRDSGEWHGLWSLLYNRTTSPNLQLSVDFNDLRSGDESISGGGDLLYNSLQVWLGFTEDIAEVMSEIPALPLIPGSNLVTMFYYSIRQKLKPGSLATAGFDMYSTFVAPSFIYTAPNPVITTTTPGVSTLRIVPALQPQELVIQQDFRNHSVLNGLSALGGLGSFLSTLFVILLGRGLMQTIRGRKPYSPFGLLHNTSREQGNIRKRCEERYPGMAREVRAFRSDPVGGSFGNPPQPGVLAFLLDSLIDVESLGFRGSIQGGAQGPDTHGHTHERGSGGGVDIEGSHAEPK